MSGSRAYYNNPPPLPPHIIAEAVSAVSNVVQSFQQHDPSAALLPSSPNIPLNPSLNPHHHLHPSNGGPTHSVKNENGGVIVLSSADVRSSGSSASSSSRPSHSAILTDDKCKFCDYRCNKRDRMKRHVDNVHLQEKPFACHLCDRSFGRKDKMKRHIETVHSDKVFQCAYCSHKSNRKDKLKTHIQVNHLNKPNNKQKHSTMGGNFIVETSPNAPWRSIVSVEDLPSSHNLIQQQSRLVD